jgi:hypothetical protein
MSSVRALAERVQGLLAGEHRLVASVAFDPAVLLTIVETIIGLVNIYDACQNNASKSLDVVADPGILGTLRLRKVVVASARRHLAGEKLYLFRHVFTIEHALRSAGLQLTQQDLGQILTEVQG